LYRNNKISKSLLRSERFGLTLNEFSVDNNDLAAKIGDEYIKKCPLQTTLFPFAIEILNYLKNKYKLHIITNGFDEVQHIKLKASGLTHFF
jgi:putative hydrolase of the HAD superfamily